MGSKQRIFAVLVAAVLSASAVIAQSVATFESVTVAGTAVGLTAATYGTPSGSPNVRCVMRLETAQVRFRYDGTDPTSSEGVLMEVGDVLTVNGHTYLSQFKAIRTGSTSGVLKVTCEN